MSDQRYRDSVPTTLFIAATSMVLGAFFVTIFLLINVRNETLENRRNGLTNQTYVRATNCFAAHNPNQRTPELRETCYNLAEQATGAKIKRYGNEAQ